MLPDLGDSLLVLGIVRSEIALVDVGSACAYEITMHGAASPPAPGMMARDDFAALIEPVAHLPLFDTDALTFQFGDSHQQLRRGRYVYDVFNLSRSMGSAATIVTGNRSFGVVICRHPADAPQVFVRPRFRLGRLLGALGVGTRQSVPAAFTKRYVIRSSDPSEISRAQRLMTWIVEQEATFSVQIDGEYIVAWASKALSQSAARLFAAQVHNLVSPAL